VSSSSSFIHVRGVFFVNNGRWRQDGGDRTPLIKCGTEKESIRGCGQNRARTRFLGKETAWVVFCFGNTTSLEIGFFDTGMRMLAERKGVFQHAF
jgi:hypothetical protein